MELLPLVGLAFVDSLSAGTLVIPLVLLISWGRMRPAHYGVYLTTIALAYFGIGVALFFGMHWLFDVIDSVTGTTWFRWSSLVLGLALLAFGIFSPNPKKQSVDEIIAKRSETKHTGTASLTAMIGLAIGAAVIEIATMLPYLAAIGIIESLGLSFPNQLLILAAYCLIMISPALLVGLLANIWGERMFGRVIRIIPRLEYEAKVTILWVVALVGLYMTANAVVQLGLIN